MLVSIPLLVELLLLIGLGVILAESDKTARRVDKYRGIISRINTMQKQVIDAGTKLSFYSISHRKDSLVQFDQIYASLESSISELTDIGDRETTHRRWIMQICAIANEVVEVMDQTRDRVADMSFLDRAGLTRLPDFLLQLTNDYVNATNILVDELEKTEQISPVDVERTYRLQVTCLAIGFLTCITFIILSFIFYKQVASRLEVLMLNTQKFADGEPLLPPIAGTDEISKLDSVFHGMSKTIQESNEFRSQIIATVSHELRSPLTSLQTFLDLLAEAAYGEVNDEITKRSRLAKDQVGRLIRLLNDLLAAESVRAKGFTIQTARVDIAKISADALASVAYLASRRQIELVNEVPSLELEADADRILQVLINLISNAIKFSPRESKITLGSELSEKQIKLKVIDEGRGVPPELQEEIFNRHSQVEEGDKTKKGGAGLGLAICKAIILQHGGQIACMNNEEKGSTFWFTLPLVSERSNESKHSG